MKKKSPECLSQKLRRQNSTRKCYSPEVTAIKRQIKAKISPKQNWSRKRVKVQIKMEKVCVSDPTEYRLLLTKPQNISQILNCEDVNKTDENPEQNHVNEEAVANANGVSNDSTNANPENPAKPPRVQKQGSQDGRTPKGISEWGLLTHNWDQTKAGHPLNRCRNEEVIVKGNLGWLLPIWAEPWDRVFIRDWKINEEVILKQNFGLAWSMLAGRPWLVMGPCIVEIDRIVIREVQYQFKVNRLLTRKTAPPP
ncbi:hypothetical protein DPMN_109399 [Dreissena polymorpha]|uniref:Uncharacterized protein n=1 Tax=Dreissena polymorpha TaxID=45954 RepID=A0A9D4KA76_DREPO|nr:hypothetical protein DPMN_109399 [Dreissena polymorpha]